MPRISDLPVFPLPLVLLPGELLPLHIFEPRYRELVARCLAGPEPFCVVLEDDAGVREVGCLARDLTVLERLADGRLNVVVSGGEPVRLGPLDDEAHSYLSAEATVLEDDDEELADDEIEAALAAYGALLSEIGREDAEPLSAQPRLSYALGARIDVGVQVGPGAARVALRARTPRPHHRGARAGPPQPARYRPSGSAARCATARSIRPPETTRSCSRRALVGVPRVGYCPGRRTCGRLLGQPAPQARKPTIAGRGSSRSVWRVERTRG